MTIEAIKEAPELEIDKNLKQLLQAEKGILPYAVVRGVVQSGTSALKSHHMPGILGVIQEEKVIEHKKEWLTVFRTWSDVTRVIQSFYNEVPFHLHSGNSQRNVTVEVVEPKMANELILSTVYNQFTPNKESLSRYMMAWLHGQHTKGFQTTEKMLVEGNILTGIGELVLVKDRIKLRPSPQGYYLTPLTKTGLIHKMECDVRYDRVLLALLACLGIGISVHLGQKVYVILKRKWHERTEKFRRQEVLRQRRKLARKTLTGDATDSGQTPMCIVCLTNPVEVLLMECRHFCVCMDCSDRLSSCPVCRCPISTPLTAYLP